MAKITAPCSQLLHYIGRKRTARPVCITPPKPGQTKARKGGKNKSVFYKICILLLIVVGLNWGLVGLFRFDLVSWLFGGSASVLSRIVYSLVGISALGAIPSLFMSSDGEH